MAEEMEYRDGDIVWVKMNKLWWPGEVHGSHRLPSDFFDQFKKPPLVVVKFFQEHNYHYVNQLHQIARFNCAKKNEFIKKGLDLYYAKHQYMEEFPADVAIAEKRTGGNPNIIYSKEFMPATKPEKTIPGSASKGTTSRSRRGQQVQPSTPSIPRVMIKPDHDTRILVSSAPAATLSPTASAADSKYKCTVCTFSTNRINTFVWHQKSHNSPKTPQVSSSRKCEQTPTPTAMDVDVPKLAASEATEEINNLVDKEGNNDVGDNTTSESKSQSNPMKSHQKTPGKRLRQTNDSRSKLTEKPPKNENKLKKILDDWSDDDIAEAGPSGLTSNKNASCIVLDTDDEDDVIRESTVKKKLKFNNDEDNDKTVTDSNDTEIVKEKTENETDELSQQIVSEITIPKETVVEEKVENKTRLGKRNMKNESTSRQSGRLQAKDNGNDETQPTRLHLRSGRPVLDDQILNLPPTPKRRGRSAKRNDDALALESVPQEITVSEVEPILPSNTETIISNVNSSNGEKLPDEIVVSPELDQKKAVSKSNSKTSRKGKPRRKEEIKLANNVSVAVLVEKTTSSSSVDKIIEQKLDLPTDGNEYTNVVHKKIRYMSHSSTDDHRKSIETPKLPEEDNECSNQIENQMIIDTDNHKTIDPVEIVNEPKGNAEEIEQNNGKLNPNDVSKTNSEIDVPTTIVSSLVPTESVENVVEKSPESELAGEHRFTQKCYKRKTIPKKDIFMDQPDVCTPSPKPFSDDTNIDQYELPSSSNLRQRTQKRYENTRNRRRSERQKDFEATSFEDFSAIVKAIDEKCEKNDRAQWKSVEMDNSTNENASTLPEMLNESGKESANSTSLLDQSSENSNSKTSTPEKADNSKELDCFDFTEDECLKPQVLNRRKRLPPVKVFELEDIDKIEEQRILDEEATRIAEQREEENQKLHVELENLLNSTTPSMLPEIPISHKAQENFPELPAEKDPEKIMAKEDDIKDRTLPPKERKKRIFKYRNRNRPADLDVKLTGTTCDAEDGQANISLHQPGRDEDTVIVTSVETVQENQMEQTEQSNEKVVTVDDEKSAAHDLKIEIAETLINFPLISPQADGNEQSHVSVVEQRDLSVVEHRDPPKLKGPIRGTRSVKKLRSAVIVEGHSKIEAESTMSAQSSVVVRNTANDSTESLSHEHNSKLCEQTSLNSSKNSSLLVSGASKSTTNPCQTNENMRLYPKTSKPALINEPESGNKLPTLSPIPTLVSQSEESTTVNSTLQQPASTSVRDFSRIKLIEKIDNNTPIQSIEEKTSSKAHPLPLKKTVIYTQTEGNSFITRIPKKRKSQMDDDIPAFVIEKPKDHPDDTVDSNSKQSLAKKEPKSFIVTKTVKKQITGELPKLNVQPAAGSVVVQNIMEVNDGIDGSLKLSHQQANTNITASQLVTQTASSINKPITGASDVSSVGSPVIVSSHIIMHKNSNTPSGTTTTGTKSSQTAGKRAVTTTSAAVPHSNVLSSLSIANRPCTIAPAKKASYRKPQDMTGLTQKQIGTDGNGNPVMIYTKISPIVTQTPPVKSQATIVMKRNEPVPSTSQLVQSYSPSLQSNPGNQFVITSKGALINKPFITTTHSTQLSQPTLTNRPNIQVHTQIIRSPSPQVFQMQQQPHPSRQSNQILIQTKPTNLLSQISPLAPVKRQPANRRSVVNKTVDMIPEQSCDRLSSPSGYPKAMNEDNTSIKKRIVRRISKNQSSATATQQTHQQIILNTEMNHIGNVANPIPPLIPINDQSSSVSSRKQQTKQPVTQMTFVQEPHVIPKAAHVEVVEEQQQENIQEILALPGDTPGFGGPPGSYFLCKLNEMGVYIPIDHQPLYLDVTDNTNLLKPNNPDAVEINATEIVTQQSPLFELNETERVIASHPSVLADQDANNPKYLINISDGQQLLVDQQSLMALANGEEFPQFVTSDGHQIILQSGQHDILSAIAFAEDVGLIAGQQILIPEDDLAVIQGHGGNHDILAAALADTEGFNQEQFIDNVLIQSNNGVEDIVDQMVYHTIPQPTVTALTNETNAVLTQPPIMSTLEHPTKRDRLSPNNSMELIGQNLDQSLAVIGVTSNTNVPTSLELPITITNPAIAPKTTSAMTSAIYTPTGATEHDLDYDLFTSTLPISHHLTQSLAINENYRTVNVINSIGDIDLDSNIVAISAANDHHSFGRH